MSISDFIVGSWNLISFSIVKHNDPSSKIKYPFGTDAMGRIIYSANGYMNATLSHKERLTFSAALEQSHLAPLEEKGMAFDTYMNYTGTYQIFPKDIQSGIIEHHVDMAFNPSMIGRIQRRDYNILPNATLKLSYLWFSPKDSNKKYSFELVWKK